MATNWGLDYPYGYLDNEPVTPKVKPEPEPNWRSMYYAEKESHAETRKQVARLMAEIKELREELDDADRFPK